jgi:transposase-like protein
MGKLIANCGEDYATRDARIAALANDHELHAKTAEKWKVQFNAPNIELIFHNINYPYLRA